MINRYFDTAATTKMSDGALEVYTKTQQTYWANPSSSHAQGKSAHDKLERERSKMSSLLSVPPSTLYFTSGASESNAIALQNLMWKKRKGTILVSSLEHPSITKYKNFFEEQGFTWISIKAPRGYISIEDLKEHITKDCVAIFTMLVHNVLGTVQDIAKISALVKEKEGEFNTTIHLHCDIAQAFGKINFSLPSLGVDSASCSAHKIEGPRGIGLLYIRENFPMRALSPGGNQEGGIRPGTESVASIAAFTYALESAMGIDKDEVMQLRRLFEQSIQPITELKLLSPSCEKSQLIAAPIVCISHPRVPSEVFTRLLFDKGFALSTTSACSNNSHASYAWPDKIGGFTPQMTKGAFRISFSHQHTKEDIIELVSAIKEVCKFF